MQKKMPCKAEKHSEGKEYVWSSTYENNTYTLKTP